MANKTHSSILKLNTSCPNLYNAEKEKEINHIGTLIANMRTKKGLSLVKFSALLEQYGVKISKSAISKWETGETTVSCYQLIAITQALEMDCDLSLFMSQGTTPELNDEGLRKVADYKADLIASGKYKPETKAGHIIKFIDMPVSDLAVSAGTGAFLDEGNFHMVSFPEASVPKGADFGVRVSGDSMEPVYHDGQIVWVQQCDRVRVGEVGVFIYDGEGYLKVYDEQDPIDSNKEDFTDSYGRIYKQPVMISYNQKYENRPVSAQAGFQVVGRVLN